MPKQENTVKNRCLKFNFLRNWSDAYDTQIRSCENTTMFVSEYSRNNDLIPKQENAA
jgi:hypothetical protein